VGADVSPRLLDSDFAHLLLLALETAHQRNLEERDNHVSLDDLEAMTDPELALAQVSNAADTLGLTLDQAAIDQLAAMAIGNALILRADWNDEVSAEISDALDDWNASPPVFSLPRAASSSDPVPDIPGDNTEHGGFNPLDPYSAGADGTVAVTDLVLGDVSLTRIVSGAGTVFSVGGSVAECVDGENCGAAVANVAADVAGSYLLGPVVWTGVKYGGLLLGNAIAAMQEQTPHVDPNYGGMGVPPGMLPYQVAQSDGGGSTEQVVDTAAMPVGG
jgi:hypothetical protein